jgi:hypothetical protein
LPRIAMLPLRHIYWLEDNEIKSIDRTAIENEIGGLSIGNLSEKIVIKIHRPWLH